MIKNIRDHKKIVLLFFCYICADIEIKVPHAKVHIRQEWVQTLTQENPGHNVLITYNNQSWLNSIHNFFSSDNKIGDFTYWSFKKLFSFVMIPQALIYCTIAYTIYKTYKLAMYIRSFFKTSQNTLYQNNSLEKTIQTQLYRKKIDYKKHIKIYNACKQYKKLSAILIRYNIRKLFWYNKEYEKSINEYIAWYEKLFSYQVY